MQPLPSLPRSLFRPSLVYVSYICIYIYIYLFTYIYIGPGPIRSHLSRCSHCLRCLDRCFARRLCMYCIYIYIERDDGVCAYPGEEDLCQVGGFMPDRVYFYSEGVAPQLCSDRCSVCRQSLVYVSYIYIYVLILFVGPSDRTCRGAAHFGAILEPSWAILL